MGGIIPTVRQIKARFFSLRRDSRGFNLTELMVSVGIGALVLVASSKLLTDFWHMERRYTAAQEYSDFVSSMSTYLHSREGCQAGLVGRDLPIDPIPFEIAVRSAANPTGFPGVNIAGPLRDNTPISRHLRIQTLRISEKLATGGNVIGGTSTNDIFRANNVVRRVAVVELRMQYLSDNRNWTIRRETFEVPVGTLNPGIRIVTCQSTKDLAGGCALAEGNQDPGTGSCRPSRFCDFSGRFMRTFCTSSNNAYPAVMGTPPCVGAATRGPVPTVNELTGAQSCPAGADAVYMGESNPPPRIFTVSCGKKCKTTVTHTYTEQYFMCMRCM